MKKMLFAVAAFAVITLSACKGGGNAATPEAAVKGFMEKMAKMDIDGAKKYATKESASVLDMMKMGVEMAKKMGGDKADSEMEKMKNAKIEYGTPKIDGDNATIAVTTISGDDKETKDIKLKKEDGSWKVAFDKSSMMGGDADKADMPTMDDVNKMKEGLEKMGDSLGDKMKEAGEKIEEATKALDTVMKK